MKCVDNFNTVYPRFASQKVNGNYVVTEPQNQGTRKFQKLTLSNVSGEAFPHELPGALCSFISKANHKGILSSNCDGILFMEHEGQKYIVLTELKSGYILEDIVHAKDQLVATYVNLVGTMSTLQDFRLDEYKVCGIIAAFEPTLEQISNLKGDDYKAYFANKLQQDCAYSMPATKCQGFYAPLNVNDFHLYYIPVPQNQIRHTASLLDVLRL